jgi:superfamily II DNA/RNA helicase
MDKTKRLVLWDKQAGVKTRIGHIIRCLYYSRAISRAASMRNVAEVKYVRYVKQIPRNNNLLTNDTFIRKIDEIIGFLSLEEKSSKIVTTALSALSAVFTEGISDFQVKSTLDILHAIKSGSLSNGIVIVADTGAGKSFGYQLPLILWILAKKIRAYLQNVKKANCSAILVFPRNVLAADQLEDLRSLTSRIEDAFSRLSLPIPTEFTEFLRFRISKDFGRIARPDREKIYTGNPDIIVTNTETLKRRMLDPLAHKIYRKGIDMVLYDEIHLYSGIHGAYVTGLNARLKAILPNQPVFVGMSATIANPEKHCQKLFALKSRPALVSDKDDVLTRKAIEHHVILKPRAGRPALGVAIDTTSCLIHNRRDGMATRDTMLDSERPKTICFSDSLDITGRWTREQDDLELAYPTLQPPTRRFHRGYPFHFAPAQETMGNSCNKCKSGKDIIASLCSFYREGLCWYFSGDSGEPNMWRIEVGQSFVPLDNLRSKRLTSQEVNMEKMKNVYDLFRRDIHDGFGNTAPIKVDNLIATGVLEVGVDFMGIKEIIMYGEVKSPANYKQKAGRGAREGNITDGLFVMSVVPSMPLANFRARLRGTHTFEENPIFTITRNNHSIDVFKPKTLQASMIPFSGNVLVCSRCISITDFDEVCPHNPFKRKYKLPSTSPIIVSQEIQRHKKATSKLRSPLSFILPEVTLLDSIKVGMAVLGFERSQFNRVVPVEYDPPIGVVVDTKGIGFKHSIDEQFIKQIFGFSNYLLRDILIQEIAIRLSGIISEQGIPGYHLEIMLSSVIFGLGLEKMNDNGKISIKELLENFAQGGWVDDAYRNLSEEATLHERFELTEDAVRAVFDALHKEKITIEDLHHAIKKRLIHTLAHTILIAGAITSGSQFEDLDYIIGEDEIVLYDSVNGGNGSSEMIFEFLTSTESFSITEYAEEILKGFTYKPKYFDESIAELLLPCPQGVAERVFHLKLQEPSYAEIQHRIQSLKSHANMYAEPMKRIGSVRVENYFPASIGFHLSRGVTGIQPSERINIAERVKEAVSICIHGCPDCVVIGSKCNAGAFTEKYNISKSLLDKYFYYKTKPIRLHVNAKQEEIESTLRKYRAVIIEVEIEKDSKTTHDKLMDVVLGLNGRKLDIGMIKFAGLWVDSPLEEQKERYSAMLVII